MFWGGLIVGSELTPVEVVVDSHVHVAKERPTESGVSPAARWSPPLDEEERPQVGKGLPRAQRTRNCVSC